MIGAKIICDSISPSDDRITTAELIYPRFIHAELLTHRVFSRNAASSRATPIDVTIAEVKSNLAMPIHWGKNQAGMQAQTELPPNQAEACEQIWRDAAKKAIAYARILQDIGAHKHVVFNLRHHPDAAPEIFELAHCLKEAINNSTPQPLSQGDWHLPYVDLVTETFAQPSDAMKISAARCARVSYYARNGKPSDHLKDLNLFERLQSSDPMHASPMEHQATPRVSSKTRQLCGNFTGWYQFRKFLEFNTPVESVVNVKEV